MSIPSPPPMRHGHGIWLQKGDQTLARVGHHEIHLFEEHIGQDDRAAVEATAEEVRNALQRLDSETWSESFDDFIEMVRGLQTASIDVNKFEPEDIPALLRLHAVVGIASQP